MSRGIGSADSIVSSAGAWTINGPHTVAFWVNFYSGDHGAANIISGANGQQMGYLSVGSPFYGAPFCRDGDLSGNYLQGDQPLFRTMTDTPEKPHHVCYVAYAAPSVANHLVMLYLDGFPIARVSNNGAAGATTNLDMSATGVGFFLQDVVCYAEALPAWKVKALALGAMPWIVSRRIHWYWPLNGLDNGSGRDKKWPTSYTYIAGATDTYSTWSVSGRIYPNFAAYDDAAMGVPFANRSVASVSGASMPTTRLFKDRVKDSTTTTGTGNITLSGTAPTGYEDFNAAFGLNQNFYYCIASAAAEWEVGVGYLSASTTMVRDTVLASSNNDNAVSFPSGTKDVFCTIAGPWVQEVLTPGRGYAAVRGYMMQ